jgi:CPA2 family monovalent cation:H+ antiporter-2
MLIEPMFVWNNLGLVLAVSAAIVVGKLLITIIAMLPFGHHRRTVMYTAVGLAQIGEFSFILAQQGVSLGVLDNFVYSLTLSGALFSTITTPLLLLAVAPVAAWLDKHFPPRPSRPGEQALTSLPSSLSGHVVICGYGRLGGHLVEALQHLGHRYVVIEQDWGRAQQARQANALVIYGDASMTSVLSGASLDTARVAAVTIPDPAIHRLVVQQIRSLCPEVPLVARARLVEDLPHLYGDGANEVIVPSFEGGLEMLRQTLTRLGVSIESIQSYTDTIHNTRYEAWRRPNSDTNLRNCLRRANNELNIEWHQVPPDSIHAGYTIGELHIRRTTGASVVAIVRDEEVIVNPEPSVVVQGGDSLAVLGSEQHRLEFVAWLKDSHVGMTVPSRLADVDSLSTSP